MPTPPRRDHPDSVCAGQPFAARSLFASPTVEIGVTRCAAEHPQFADPGPVAAPCFLFPSTAVRVEKPGTEPFVSGAGIVAFHNSGERVWRSSVSGAGDHHVWFALPGLRAEPFPVAHGPADEAAYLGHELLLRHLLEGHGAEALFIEESALRLLAHVTRQALRVQETRKRSTRSRRDVAEQAKLVLAGTFETSLGLRGLAERVGCSQFYLARAFREHTGTTLHSYRSRLRLARALTRITQGEHSLTDLALELGYSSHSHLTSTFRKAFGIPPSALRTALQSRGSTRRLLEQVLASLELPRTS